VTSTENGSNALVTGWVDGIISKARTKVRCSASESNTSQPSVARRSTRMATRWLRLSIDRTGPSGVSPYDAPPFEIDDLSAETDLTTIRHAGA
jgi:hypothetical protein